MLSASLPPKDLLDPSGSVTSSTPSGFGSHQMPSAGTAEMSLDRLTRDLSDCESAA
jgi:hypothetical protein